MASKTQHYQLEMLSPGDPFSTDGQQFTMADRQSIDRILYVGAQGHRHTGDTAIQADPTQALTISLSASGGSIPAGTTLYYAYTWADPSGFETAPSPYASVTTPAQVATPGPPVVSPTLATGTLVAGDYFYALSAYTGSNTSETAVGVAGVVTLYATGENTIVFPSLPAGADGFNIYRLDPNGVNYLYLASVSMTGATPPTSYVDNGSVTEDCNRIAPTRNTTNASNSVTVALPVSVPTGFTWNLYRTTQSGDWTNSYLVSVVESTGATPTLATTYTDTGIGAGSGQPPTSSELLTDPSQIDLGSEVTGVLPAANVQSWFETSFSFPGTVTVQDGSQAWVCDFGHATIVSCRASLGVGDSPASQDVIVDVLKGSGLTPSYSSIYQGATPNTKPYVAVGDQIGPACPPNTTSLVAGDSLTVNVLQAGGGATPSDKDLLVTILMQVGA